MSPRPVEWRRILTAEPKDERRDLEQTAAGRELLTPSTAAGIGAVLQSYEQIYLEKEQLRTECEELRRHLNRLRSEQNSAKSRITNPRASEALDLLNQLRESMAELHNGLRSLEIEVAQLRGAPAQKPVDGAGAPGHARIREFAHQDAHSTDGINEPVNGSIAKMVAEWMFPNPSAAQIRLVEDALKSQHVQIS